MSKARSAKSPSPVKNKKPDPKHWSQCIQESIISAGPEGLLSVVIKGGADNGQFCYISEIKQDKVKYHSGKLHQDDIILEIQGRKVAGYVLRDLLNWLKQVSRNGEPVMFKTIQAKTGLLPRDLRQYLSTRFQKNSIDHDQQQTIRDNLYMRTVPCTTRKARPGEINGVDYTFLNVNEFLALEKSGNLLESGIYDGNHYGTPKPPKDPVSSPFKRTSSAGQILSGQYPPSEGKRRRNLSNVEMGSPPTSPELMKRDEPHRRGEDDKQLDRDLRHENLENLPPNWEMAYTEDGTPYFIDHNTETTHWLDPRQKEGKRKPEECDENENKPPPSQPAAEPKDGDKSDKPPPTKPVSELPYGWEKVEDPHYGTYYIDHVNRKTQYENPVTAAKKDRSDGSSEPSQTPPPFREDPSGIFNRESPRSSMRMNGHPPPHPADKPKPFFTKNPEELEGEFIRTNLVKSGRGFGFTIVGGDDSDEEFLQIKSVVSNGPAFLDGKLQMGDVLVYVNSTCVLGFTHQDVVAIFQSIPVGERVTLEVCRGYPLPFDPNDPNTEIVTTVAVTKPQRLPSVNSSTYSMAQGSHVGNGEPSIPHRGTKSMPDLTHNISSNSIIPTRNKSLDELQNNSAEEMLSVIPGSTKPELLSMKIVRGPMGFGFTIADSAYGQKVKQILDRDRCQNLIEGDILVEINQVKVKDMPHTEVVKMLKDCPKGQAASIIVQRGGLLTPSKGRKKVPSARSGGASNSREMDQPPPRSPFYSPDMLNSSGQESKDTNAAEKTDAAGVTRPVTAAAASASTAKDAKENKDEKAAGDGKVEGQPKTNGEDRYTNGPYRSDGSRTPPPDPNYRPRTPSGRARTQSAREGRLPGGDPPDRNMDSYANPSSRDPRYMDYPDPGPMHSPNSMHLQPDYNDSFRSDPQFNAYGPGFRRDFDRVVSASFRYPNERPDHNEGRREFRSRTPGPEMMRSGPDSFGEDPYQRSRTPNPHEMRSKTPTRELSYTSGASHSISGTPDFIPASQYQKSPRSERDYPNNARYMDPPYQRPQDGVTDRKSRPPSGPEYNQQYKDNTGANARLNTSGTYSDSLSFNSDRQRDSQMDSYNGQRGQSEPTDVPPGGYPRRLSTSFEHEIPMPSDLTKIPRVDPRLGPLEEDDVNFSHSPSRLPYDEGRYVEMNVFLRRQETGFGFRIIGGTEEGTQVSVGHIMPGGAAELDSRIRTGDEITYVDGQNVMGTSHRRVVQLMGQAAIAGKVSLGLRRRIPSDSFRSQHLNDYPYDVTVRRKENEGFGFVIISSVTRSGSTIGRIVEHSPAERCGRLHVGDRILAVNNVDIMHMHHEDIVNLIKESGYAVTLTVGPPQDDASSTASTSQRSSQGSMINAMAYPAQGEVDRRGEYSPGHYSRPATAPPDHRYNQQQQILEKHKEIVRQSNQAGEPSEDRYDVVELHRGSRGFGFSIRGGKEFNNMPLFVLRIAEGGAADVDGRLKVGDQILEINNISTQDMTHAEAINIIQNGGSTVSLLVKRVGKLPPAMERLTVRSPPANALLNGPLSQSSPNTDQQPSSGYYMGGYGSPRQQHNMGY